MSQSPKSVPAADLTPSDNAEKENTPSSPIQKSSTTTWPSSLSTASKARQNSPLHINSSVTPPSNDMASLSPSATDRVFPIRSVVSVDPTPTPTPTPTQRGQGVGEYFHPYSRASESRVPSSARRQSASSTTSHSSQTSQRGPAPRHSAAGPDAIPKALASSAQEGRRGSAMAQRSESSRMVPPRLRSGESGDTANSGATSLLLDRPLSPGASSAKSGQSSMGDMGGLVTHRFKHVLTDGGHAVITGRDGETLQRCEDEPIHIPGAVQGFGLLIALQEDPDGSGGLPVRIVSENSKRIIGRSPRDLFALESFTDILSVEQADNLLDHIDFIKDEDTDVVTNGPEVFTISVKIPNARSRKLWCAMHINDTNPGLIICEFELEDDPINPLVPPNDHTPDLPEDTLNSNPTAEEFAESTEIKSRPLRILRSARKRKGEAAAMEVFNIMSQVQEQLAAAPNLEKFLQVLVGVVKELTGFHRVMIYQFDQAFNGRVVTELVDPRATKDLYKGLNFPASDIPKQARELYKLNRVRMLYDRDQQTARLVCRTAEDLENPLDLTHSYLRAMSPIHLKYLANMALWGLIACHSYGQHGMRVSFPIRKMCRLVGDSASRNIERLSYASRLQARKLINTVPTQHNPSGYIIASSDDLLKLFDADFGLLSIRDETKILGQLEQSQEALAMLEYLRMRKITSVMTSQDITLDFPDLRYPPGFQIIAGMLIVPLSVGGIDFIVFFRRGQLKEFIKEGTEGYLEPRRSFKTWRETVVGKCREWTEEEIETAAVLCLVYGKFIESSQLTRLLLANSAHEVRTPLNAIINYLEIALEGSLDQETRENLARSHSASKSLIYTEEGGALIKGEATDMFQGDAKRKGISYEVIEHSGLPRTSISNITANAIQKTFQGGVKDHVGVEVAVTDSGLFNDLEQGAIARNPVSSAEEGQKTTLGLGLAVLRLKSEEGKGSRFVIQFPFDLPDSAGQEFPDPSPEGSITPQPETALQGEEELTLVAPGLSRTGSGSGKVAKKESTDSLNSKTSLRSFKSGSSGKSQRSDVDRLIEAIQESHMVEKRPKSGERSLSAWSARPPLTKRLSTDREQPNPPRRVRSKSLEMAEGVVLSPHQRSLEPSTPGEEHILYSNYPLRAIKVPDESGSSPSRDQPQTGILGEVPDGPEQITPSPDLLTPHNMRVLVAEDDPVNSKILKKRLEKIGHEIHHTINGEECAGTFGDKPQAFDVVLMDMQMPIVDGLTSTKMIRSFEKTHPDTLSPRAALCGRVPIIAVSASLVEKERETYISAGFDAWILKPISFSRLAELMTAIVDGKVREDCLYQPGQWERGGWFHTGQKSSSEVDTVPSGQPLCANPSENVRAAAVESDNPTAGDEVGEIPGEQERLLKSEGKHVHYESEDENQSTVRERDPGRWLR
ncbi:uncharacterized protein BDR25DRAFT_333393 [Lindgomyces ingoldianus]|uniref:Uncharacterized protein n=1 Tax=Lindgomyces ingoldianus TaxID=673940 RepID=A0ACB6R0L8_9PLEO|nr:uncharacterized protein BDR25DRAFT_333393 [Lindgomyces ingoldianus]KAF2472635.1 hypothetical protein BDR25DRAFT_333393 [Lindgomyces ingoldianus]